MEESIGRKTTLVEVRGGTEDGWSDDEHVELTYGMKFAVAQIQKMENEEDTDTIIFEVEKEDEGYRQGFACCGYAALNGRRVKVYYPVDANNLDFGTGTFVDVDELVKLTFVSVVSNNDMDRVTKLMGFKGFEDMLDSVELAGVLNQLVEYQAKTIGDNKRAALGEMVNDIYLVNDNKIAEVDEFDPKGHAAVVFVYNNGNGNCMDLVITRLFTVAGRSGLWAIRNMF